jgi:ubiquinone/menaquinone biosynthesis C-methylase UbiE
MVVAEYGLDRGSETGVVTASMTLDEAILWFRANPSCADLVADAYLGRDVAASADRFLRSAEFAEVKRLLGPMLHNAVVADIGAGAGIASYALHKSGASRVFAVEPDASDEVGRGAIERLREDTSTPIEILDGWGESLPLPDDSIDVVYLRQVLHHAADLERFMSEVARVLRPDGVLLACREHVVDNESQKKAFLDSHPVHRLAGGENAYSLPQYLDAIARNGLVLAALLGPWDSVLNAFPAVRSTDDLAHYPARRLEAHFGSLGRGASHLPGVTALVWWRIRRPRPGRMYSFLCSKQPETGLGPM